MVWGPSPLGQMRLVFKKVILDSPELQPSDLICTPVLRSPGSIACSETDHSYGAHGSTAVCKGQSSCLCWRRDDLSESSKGEKWILEEGSLRVFGDNWCLIFPGLSVYIQKKKKKKSISCLRINFWYWNCEINVLQWLTLVCRSLQIRLLP